MTACSTLDLVVESIVAAWGVAITVLVLAVIVKEIVRK
jgi:hypothetical protein